MAYEIRPNSGSLFRNDKASKPTDPTHTGQADIAGEAYRVSAWVNEAKDGRKYFSLKFTAKVSADSPHTRPAKPEPEPFHDDDLPF
jgi:hypothetical protein